MKKPDVYLKEYCTRLSDENLNFLHTRLGQKLSGDMAEALDFLSSVKEIDRWLSSADSSGEFFDMVDLILAACEQEHKKRFSEAA